MSDHPDYKPLIEGMVKALLSEQREDGAWQIYFEAPAGDVNTTVEAYAALRTAGMSPEAEPLRRARAWIEGKGGLSKVRVFTRYWLALIGVWPWQKTPNIPAEVIRFPVWFPFSIYNFASWARATLMPISILSATRPVAPLPGGDQLDELFPARPRQRLTSRCRRRARARSPGSAFSSPPTRSCTGCRTAASSRAAAPRSHTRP